MTQSSSRGAHTQTMTVGGKSSRNVPRPVRLLVLDGPDVGVELTLHAGTAVAGTHSGCQLRLTDKTVSRRHASFELLGRSVRVTDLGSKNGTRYQGAQVEVTTVPVGGVVSLGSTVVVVEALPEAQVEPLSARTELEGMIGRSTPMRKLFAEIDRVAPTDVPVLIQGETGVGKERVARALHALSPRREGPFQVVDCGALSRELLASALFGHVRGAFTGAVRDEPGLLRQADGGTLFLDEIGELPVELQAALLRALQSKSVTPVGGGEPYAVDFRVVAATHRDLEKALARGTFRSDLYYRLSGVVLRVPALRERPQDIPMLAERFAARLGPTSIRLSPADVAALCAYPWPGNVRELEHAVERMLVLGKPATGEQPAFVGGDYHSAREAALKAFERVYLEALLKEHDGSAPAAARAAKLARSYFYRLLEAHGLKGSKG